jgi:hypothetical protein
MYETFKTDRDLESKGIVLDYGSFRVTVARAGGANRGFERALEQKTRPFRRAIQADTFGMDRMKQLVKETFVETCVRNWEVNLGSIEDPNWQQGIEAEDGSLLPYNRENVLDVFNKLPDLYNDMQEQAAKAALFRVEVREEEAKN